MSGFFLISPCRTLALKALDSRLANAGASNPRSSGVGGRLGTPSRAPPAVATSATGPTTVTNAANGSLGGGRASADQGKGKGKAPEEAT